MAILLPVSIVLACVGIIATLLPLLPLGSPLVRVWDFPRTQVTIVLGAALFMLTLSYEWGVAMGALAAVTAACLAWQLRAILPYTRLVGVEIKAADEAARDGAGRPVCELRLMSANVLISNRDVEALRRVVESRRPDVLLLVETDDWWDAQLTFLRDLYPHVVSQPQDNSYGMHLFSRFELADVEVRFLVSDDIPSIKARVLAGIDVALYCVHPQPPPFVHSQERDAELLLVGKEVRRAAVPAIVAGDLNDVAWSRSTRLFQKVSGLLDPRVGRGSFNTFSARLPFFIRWPLDHVFFSEHFHVVEIAVLEDIGSDHFPFFVHLAFLGQASGEKPCADSDARAEAEKTIESGKQQAAGES